MEVLGSLNYYIKWLLRIASISLYYVLLNNLRGHFLSCHTLWRFNSLFVCKVCKMSLLFAASIACPLKSVCGQYFLVNWVQVSSIRRVRWYLDKRNSFNVHIIFWSQASLAVRLFQGHKIEQGIYIDSFHSSCSFSSFQVLVRSVICTPCSIVENQLYVAMISPIFILLFPFMTEAAPRNQVTYQTIYQTIWQSYKQKIWQSDNLWDHFNFPSRTVDSFLMCWLTVLPNA